MARWRGTGVTRSGDQGRSSLRHRAADPSRLARLALATLGVALASLPVSRANAAAPVLPEVVVAVDTSESMQLSIDKGAAPDCAAPSPAATRWTATLQMLLGTIGSYGCTKESLPAHADSANPPKQLVGAKSCIGGVDHTISSRTAAKDSQATATPLGIKSYSGSIPNPATQLRLLVKNGDAAVPYFVYDVDHVDTSKDWVEGDLTLTTKDKSVVNNTDVWAFLVKFSTNPANLNGKIMVCDAMRQLKTHAVSGPTKLNNVADGKTVFTLDSDELKAMRTAAKAGQKTFFFGVVTQKAWYKADCSGRGDDLTEVVDIAFHGPGAPWTERRPILEVGVGQKCPAEGPGAHYAPVGGHGSDGALSKFADAAKFGLLVPDSVMKSANDASGAFSFGDVFGSYWGDINLGAQDPFASGTSSVPVPRPDNSTARLNSIAVMKTNLSAVKPVGGTPLASLIEDLSAYFGPGTHQDPHFQTKDADPSAGDPYYTCRTRMAILFTDGGANLHTGASDGRSAAVQAAADLWTKGIALYVVVPGSAAVPKADLTFLDEVAAAGGTSNAWRLDTAADLNAKLKTVLQAAGTDGQVLTPTVATSATGIDSDVQHSVHAKSNFDLTEPMQTWGVIEERLFGCTDKCVNAKTPNRAQVCNVIDFGWMMNNRSRPRRQYTHVGGKRRVLNATSVSPDDMLIPKTGLAPKLVLDLSNNCVTLPNTFNLANPVERIAYGVDVLGQVRADSGSCRANRKLGAVGRAGMAVLTPASQVAFGEASFRAYAARAVPASATYSSSVRPGSEGRPTMVFASTHEGVLHGFRTDRDSKITTIDKAVAGDEVFAWMPLFNLQRIRQLRLVADADRSFLGGDVVTGHVQLDRNANSVGALSDKWRAVVVAGAGEAGSGYFALDVTVPDDPRLLWEIAPHFHCFGSGVLGGTSGPACLNVKTYEGLGRSTAKPVLATAFVKHKGVTTRKAVAILAGGKPPLDSKIQNQGVDGTGERAIWVVDMANGDLIRKLTTKDIDLTGSTVLVNDKDKDLGYYWTAPSCFQTSPGSVVSRCFVGDSKGVVWRVDISDSNPAKWKLTFFHDAYSHADVPATYRVGIKSNKRVPVLSPPSLSTDRDGGVVIVYGTGNSEDEAALARRHIVFALKEKATLAANGVASKIEAESLWLKLLPDDTRYIGPPTVFSRNAYWASYTQTPGGLCGSGTARVWGAHYTRRTAPSDPQSILGAFPNPSSGAANANTLTDLIVGSEIPSPIEIMEVPACVAGCAPSDFTCLILAKKSAAAASKPTYEVNAGVASGTQGKYQKPSSGKQPNVGTITRGTATPRSTTVITGWDLLFD